MDIKHIIDKIRNNYWTIILALIISSAGIYYYFHLNSIEDFYPLSNYPFDNLMRGIMIIGFFLFIVSIWLDNERLDNKKTRKISIASIVAIILTIIAVIRITMDSNVVNSLKYSNEPYITGKALLVEKYVRERRPKKTVHKFLLPNGKIIQQPTGHPVFFRMDISNCFLIKYRQNEYVMEVHFVENLGYIDKQECLAK